MGNRDLEEKQEREFAERVATALDVSVDQLDKLEWSLDENVGNDGTVYGYVITFEETDDAETQAFLDRLTGGKGWVQIGHPL